MSTVSLRKKAKKNDYSFFHKLKVKYKKPSKTPYLDKKCWNSTYSLKNYDFSNNQNNNVINRKNKSNISLVEIPKEIKSNLEDRDNNIIKNNTDKNSSDKIVLLKKNGKDNTKNNGRDNAKNNANDNEKAIIPADNKDNINEKKEIKNEIKNEMKNKINNELINEPKNIDNYRANENKIIFANKKESKNKKPNNIIFNFLNKPFFCCLKS